MPENNGLLPPFIKELLGDDLKQQELARKVGVSSSCISQVTRGQTVPSDEWLDKLANTLRKETRLPQLLLRAAHDRAPEGGEGHTLRCAFLQMIRELGSQEATPRALPHGRTVRDFPYAFEPLVVVTGDKREDPPKTIGDIGALSASPLDDRFLGLIDLPTDTDKVSDKVFVLADESYLRKTFGRRNLLVIGSPASNHLARKVNQSALFRFAFSAETTREIDAIIAEGHQAIQDRGTAGLKYLRDGKMTDLKFMMHEFKQGGIFDPLPQRRKLRARSLRDGVDFATITVARNPYAESNQFVAIMAAGFHLPGTVHAVKMLSDPSAFSSRPLGGVVEVRMDEAMWYERIEKATPQWDTNEYEVKDVIDALARIPDTGDLPVTPDEAKSLVKLLEDLAPDSADRRRRPRSKSRSD